MTKLKQLRAVLFNFIIFFAFLIASLSLPAQANAGTAFVDTAAVKSAMSLVPYSEYLVDPGASLKIEELFSAGETQNFKALSNGIPLTFSGSVWLRITLAPTTKPSPDGELVLDLGTSVPKGATLYYPVNNQEPGQPSVWQGRKPGAAYSLAIANGDEAQTSIKLSSSQIKLPPANEINPTTIYVNVPGTPSIWFAPTLRTAEDAMRDKESVPLYFAMCLLGVCIALCLLRAFRDGGEWRLWTAVLGALILSQTLIDLPPMPKGQVPFSGLLNVLIPALSLALIPHIARHLFDSKAINKNFDKLWLYLSILGGIVPIFALVPGYSWIIRILPLWPVLAFLPGLFALGAVAKKLPGAGKYTFACFLLAGCTLLSLLATTNAAPNSIFLTTPLWGGSIFALLIGILPLNRKNEYTDKPQVVVNEKASGPTLALGDVLDLGGLSKSNYSSSNVEEDAPEDIDFLVKSLHNSQQGYSSNQNLPAGANAILNETRIEHQEDILLLTEDVLQQANATEFTAPENKLKAFGKLSIQAEESETQASAAPVQAEMSIQQSEPPTPAWALHLKNKKEINTLEQNEGNEEGINTTTATPFGLLSSDQASPVLPQTSLNMAESIADTNNVWVAPAKEESTQSLDSVNAEPADPAQATSFALGEELGEKLGGEEKEELSEPTKFEPETKIDDQQDTSPLSLPEQAESKDYIPAWARSTIANAKLKAEEEAQAAPTSTFKYPSAFKTEVENLEQPATPHKQEAQAEAPEGHENPEWTPSVKPADVAVTPRPMPYPARSHASHALGKITHINSVLPIVSAEEPARELGQNKNKAPRAPHIPMSPWAKTIAKEAMQLDATSLGRIEECLKVPLEALVQAASELSTCSLPPLARQRSEAIIKSSQVLSELVNTLTSAPNEPLEMLEKESDDDAVFDLQVVLREAHDTVVNKAERRGLALSWFMPPHMPLLYIGNPIQLQNVLRLLLDSAIESTYRGSVQIAVRRVPDSTNPGHLVFTVTDTGQTSPSLRRSTTALMRAWEMVTADGGALSLDSAPNHGTIVSFTLHLKVPGKQMQNILPVYNQASGADSSIFENQDNILYPGLQPENHNLSLTRLQPLNILVADEQTTNRQLLSFFLNDLPYTIEEARTVKEAIAIYAEAPVGLVIFDSTLTDLDLPTAIKTVHDIDASLNIPPVPIVALVQNHADINPAMEFGSSAAIRKPLSRGKVRDIVTRLLPIPEEVLNAMRPKAEPIVKQETAPTQEEAQPPAEEACEQNTSVEAQAKNQETENEDTVQEVKHENEVLASEVLGSNNAEALTLDPVEGVISGVEQQEEAIELQPWKAENQIQTNELTNPEKEDVAKAKDPACLAIEPEAAKPEASNENTDAANADADRPEGSLSLAAAARRFMRIRRKHAPEPLPSAHMEIIEDGTVSAPRPVGSLSSKHAASAETERENPTPSNYINNEAFNSQINEPSSYVQTPAYDHKQANGSWQPQVQSPYEADHPVDDISSQPESFKQDRQVDEHENSLALNWGSGESVSEPRPIIKKEPEAPLKTAPIQGNGDELDPEVIHLIPGLLDSLDMALNDAYSGLENASFLTVAEACMRISGTADAHGLRVLKGIANCVERAANANDLDAVTDLLAELDSSVQNNRKKLEKIYDSHTHN